MSPEASPKIYVYDHAAMLYEETARAILHLTRAKDGPFSIALAGGATPKGLYVRMAQPPFRDLFDWDQIHFFWGDERWVPPSDKRSNQLMVRESLLKKASIQEDHIHPVPVGLASAEEVAQAYEKRLREFFQTSETFPAFDLILLGLGEDGHTASLFPGEKALDEKNAWVCVTRRDSEEPRISLTLPVINRANHVFFLVSGSRKKNILKEVLHPGAETPDYPARRVNPENRQLVWFVDRNAASAAK